MLAEGTCFNCTVPVKSEPRISGYCKYKGVGFCSGHFTSALGQKRTLLSDFILKSTFTAVSLIDQSLQTESSVKVYPVVGFAECTQ